MSTTNIPCSDLAEAILRNRTVEFAWQATSLSSIHAVMMALGGAALPSGSATPEIPLHDQLYIGVRGYGFIRISVGSIVNKEVMDRCFSGLAGTDYLESLINGTSVRISELISHANKPGAMTPEIGLAADDGVPRLVLPEML